MTNTMATSLPTAGVFLLSLLAFQSQVAASHWDPSTYGHHQSPHSGRRGVKSHLATIKLKGHQYAATKKQNVISKTDTDKNRSNALQRVLRKKSTLQKRSLYHLLKALQPKKSSPLEETRNPHRKKYQMYITCFAIISSWFALGTLFYSYYNQWPMPQSFFYAVDAGMHIGFCVDVKETKIGSRAFTIIYILIGASFIGGAIAYMVQSIIEGAASRSAILYKQILERDSLKKGFFKGTSGGVVTSTSRGVHRGDKGRKDGILSYEEFQMVLEENDCNLSPDAFRVVCEIYDPKQNGFIDYEDFSRIFQGTDRIIPSRKNLARRIWDGLASIFTDENRIYLWFVTWVALGIAYGMKSQKWDFITATHFAISALATGGLTAPPVDENGILPADSAIFCGLYCIFGIPLFAMTLGQFASVLIEDYIVEEEHAAITQPLSKSEFQFASKSLCTKDDAVHLSDFIVLQLMRQGKMSLESLEFMKRQFELCDKDRSGTLSWSEATQLSEKLR